jgi:hypothetical protein
MLIKKLKMRVKDAVYNRKLQHQIIEAAANFNRPRSVIFYTTHKCASTFISNLFDVILKRSDYDLIDYAGAIWNARDKINPTSPYEVFLEQAYTDLYSLNGKIYAPQRRYLDFPGRSKFKHIFFLRDPRDILVSSYFSMAFTHSEPSNSIARDRFLSRRNEIKEQDIDDYVLVQAEEWVVPLYKQYKELRETSETYIYLKYDVFADNTPEFVKTISEFLGLNPSREDMELLTKNASPVQSIEVMNHKRSGKTGQYLQKLRPTTVEKLNYILSEVLFDWEFKI